MAPAIKNRWYCVLIALILFLGLTLSSNTFAQIKNLDSGDKVRVYAPSIEYQAIYGTIYDITASALFLDSDDFSIRIPFDTIKSLDLHRGKRRNTGKGAFIGTASGILIGGIFGLVAYEECESDAFCWDFGRGAQALFGAGLGAASGLVIGSIIGFWTITDRWVEVPINVSIGYNYFPTNHNKINSGITLRFTIIGK